MTFIIVTALLIPVSYHEVGVQLNAPLHDLDGTTVAFKRNSCEKGIWTSQRNSIVFWKLENTEGERFLLKNKIFEEIGAYFFKCLMRRKYDLHKHRVKFSVYIGTL